MTNFRMILSTFFASFTFSLSVSAYAQTSDFNKRCSIRVYTALTNQIPTLAINGSDAREKLEDIFRSETFKEHFATFLNSKFNDEPGEYPGQEAPYFLAKHVLDNQLPFKDIFVGRYQVEPDPDRPRTTVPTVRIDENGLGYFSSREWMFRYAGNEEEGKRLVAAYRILNNTVGLKLSVVSSQPLSGPPAKDRSDPRCAACHYNSWYALDDVADILGTVKVGANTQQTRFTPYNKGPVDRLGGIKIANPRQLVEALVESENFNVHACSLAFQFVSGREVNSCETNSFDACMRAFKKTGKIQDAISSFIKQANYCQ